MKGEFIMCMRAIDFVTLSGTVVLNRDFLTGFFATIALCFKYGSNRVEEIY